MQASWSSLKTQQQSAHPLQRCARVHSNTHTHTHTHRLTVGEGASLCSPAVLSDCSVCWATAAMIPHYPPTPHSPHLHSVLLAHVGPKHQYPRSDIDAQYLFTTHIYSAHEYSLILCGVFFSLLIFLFFSLPPSPSFLIILWPFCSSVCTVSADSLLCLSVFKHCSIRDTPSSPHYSLTFPHWQLSLQCNPFMGLGLCESNSIKFQQPRACFEKDLTTFFG